MTVLARRHLLPAVRLPDPVRVAAAAASGHVVGAVVGTVVLAGPAAGWPAARGLMLVHLLADLGAGLGAARAGRWVRPVVVVGAVVAGGVIASGVVLGLLGTGPPWLLVRAALVVVLAVVVVGRRPTTNRT